MPENTFPQNNIKIDGSDNSLSGINQGGVQQNVTINTNPPYPPIDQIVTTDTAGKLTSKVFLQRDDEINEVIKLICNDPQITLQIRGIGGLGKTSLCCQLFWKYFNSDDKDIKHLGWISYTGDLKSSIMGKINSKDVTAEDPELYLCQAKKFFNSLKGSLLLFVDNADDITEDDIDFLNSCACRVVITARYEIEEFEEYNLPPFSSEVCMELYRKLSKDKSEDDESAIREIVELTGHHTQTICLLARTQKECGYTAQELLGELKKRGFTLEGVSAEISSGRPGEKFEATFFEHMMKLFDIAKIKDANQLRVLKLFSLLAPNQPLKRTTSNDWFNSKNIKKLIQRGWLNEYENGDVYIHPVIAQVVRNSSPTELKSAEKFIHNMASALKGCMRKGFIFQNKLMPHAISIAEYFSYEEDLTLSPLYNYIGIIYREMADYENALKYHEKDRVICEKDLGIWQNNTGNTYDNIANVYLAMGEYDKALVYYEKALAIAEKVLGTEHLNTAATYDNIAIVYSDMGDYDKALEYFEKSKAIREKKLGAEHPDTASTYCNMANVYSEMGNYDKALEYLEKSKAIREKKLGAEHPDTAAAYGNIATLYSTMGDYDKALEYYDKSKAIREKKLGAEHPDSAAVYGNMAIVYLYMGNYDKALEYFEKSKVIREKKLGAEHPETAAIYHNLGYFSKETGKINDALEYAKKAQVIFEKKLGEHYRTAMTYNLLADIYLLSKDIKNAKKFAEIARDIYVKKSFTEHPHTAENFRTLAEIALAEDDVTKALTEAEKAKAIFESKLKEGHHNTIKTYRVLADIYEKLNDTQKAMEYRAKAEK